MSGGIHGDRHADRGELHGITVVLTGLSGKVYLGRWHEQTERGVVMKNVAIFDPLLAGAATPAEWLQQQRKYGINATEKVYIVPNGEAGDVVVFG